MFGVGAFTCLATSLVPEFLFVCLLACLFSKVLLETDEFLWI